MSCAVKFSQLLHTHAAMKSPLTDSSSVKATPNADGRLTTSSFFHLLRQLQTQAHSHLLLPPLPMQFERDVMIWNNKTYTSRPLLVKEDSSIQKHRRWFSQFYSENSPRLQQRRDTLDF